MKPRLRLAFCDFWPNFNQSNNYFTRLLGPRYEIELSDQPDFVVYSCFGRAHRRFSCTRIFFSGENWRPDFSVCDWAFTFDHCNHPRHYRLPLYALYHDPQSLVKQDFDPSRALAQKTRFCSFVYSNPLCRARNRFFQLLSKYKRVDSGGKLYNNVGGRVADKLAFVRQSKFTIAFENESHDGYTTEKLSEGLIAGCLPIYWGNLRVHLDFNPRSFINVHDWPSLEAAVERVIEVDRDDALYLEHMGQPWFHDNRVNSYVDPANVLAQFERIVEDRQTPIARQASSRKFYLFDPAHTGIRLRATSERMRLRIKRSTRKLVYRLSGV